jgi:hypothetical protein
MWKGGLMKKSFKVIFAAVLLFILSAPFVSANDDMGIPLDTYTKGGVGYSFVYFDGILYTIISDGNYDFHFEEYDDEWVELEIIPNGERPPLYTPVYIQWGTFDPVFLTYDPLEGGTYLLGSETGYAEK